MIKYQSFKNSVLLRIFFQKELAELEQNDEEFHNSDDPDEMKAISDFSSKKKEEIEKQIQRAIDNVIDDEPFFKWKELLNSINAEKFFQNDILGYPFNQVFDPTNILEKHYQKNKK